MAASERTHLLDSLAQGTLSLRELAGISREEMRTLSDQAEKARDTKDFEQAVALFGLLDALAPEFVEYAIQQAEILSDLGRKEESLACLERAFAAEAAWQKSWLVRALQLHVRLGSKRGDSAAALAVLTEEAS